MSNLWIPRTASAVRALTALRRPTTLHLRYYRGQAGEAPPVLSEKEESLIKVAKPKSEEILAKHHRLPNVAEIPPASLDPTQNNLDIRRKRLIYRSKQRGWLEVDLLLGTWAHENVHLLTEDELDEYEAFVNFETIEYVQRACAGDHFPRFFFWKSSLLTPFCFWCSIYNIITLRLDVPEHLKTPDGNGVVERIQAWARASPLGQADPEKYKEVKTASKLI